MVEAHVGGQGTLRRLLTDVARKMVQTFLSLLARMFQLVAEEAGRGSFL
jgi:hypothetical protein